MPFIYDDHPVKDKKKETKFDVDRYDATSYWVYHYKNWIKLDQLSKRCSFQDRMQIENEMLIAQRKMKYWERQANFDMLRATKLIKQ